MTKVNFKVEKIAKATKDGYVRLEVKFDGSSITESFVRKAYGDTTILDGCRIYFNKNFDVLNVVREYETSGKKKSKNTSNIGKKKTTALEPKTEIAEVKVIPEITSKEARHEKYNEIRMCLECNIPVYLAGPAGSGKNYTVEQIAKDLGWDFYFSNSVQQEYKLTGFIDAGGKFHETEFYKACTNGNDCIFFLDEIDASIPEVLVLLNAAIANGYFEFPNGRVDFTHVHFVAAGNTVGSGADEMYTGRMVIDQATLDRFAIIEFGYSKSVEMFISNSNSDLVNFIHQMRAEAEAKGIRATFSYRCITMITKLESAGMDLKNAMIISVLKGLDKDTINTFNPIGYSKYHSALKDIQKAA